jgi:hypothetical protein
MCIEVADPRRAGCIRRFCDNGPKVSRKVIGHVAGSEGHVVEEHVCTYFFTDLSRGGLIDWTDWGPEANPLGMDLPPSLKSPLLVGLYCTVIFLFYFCPLKGSFFPIVIVMHRDPHHARTD